MAGCEESVCKVHKDTTKQLACGYLSRLEIPPVHSLRFLSRETNMPCRAAGRPKEYPNSGRLSVSVVIHHDDNNVNAMQVTTMFDSTCYRLNRRQVSASSLCQQNYIEPTTVCELYYSILSKARSVEGRSG